MSLRFESLAASLLVVGGATLYTVPAGYRILFKSYAVDNIDGAAAHTYTLGVIKGGVTIYLVIAINLLANGTDRKNDLHVVLNPGDTIFGVASANTFIHASLDGISQKLF